MILADALKAIEARREFAVIRKGGLVTINYVVQMPGTFDGIRRDFRGIIFDEATGECLARPLHKFHGVGQTPETLFHLIHNRTATIFEKLDGSMVQWLIVEGRLRAATRSGVGTVQADAAEWLAETLGLLTDIRMEVEDGFTPIFEFLSPKYPIVVRHPVSRLVYLCSRDREVGDYHFDSPYPDKAARFEFPFAEVMDQLADRRDFEGFVCWLDDGTTVKAKCPWYTERHRVFDAMLRPAYKLYGLVFAGVMDDLIAAAQPHHKASLERVYAEAQGDLLDETMRLETLHSGFSRRAAWAHGRPEHRGIYVECVKQEAPLMLGGLMRLYDGRSAGDWSKARLMDRYKAMYPDPVVIDTEEGVASDA